MAQDKTQDKTQVDLSAQELMQALPINHDQASAIAAILRMKKRELEGFWPDHSAPTACGESDAFSWIVLTSTFPKARCSSSQDVSVETMPTSCGLLEGWEEEGQMMLRCTERW